MKKLLLTAFVAASLNLASLRADSLLYAIDSHNVEEVKILLSQHEHLHHEYKKKLMRAAEQASHAAKEKIGHFSSGTDFLKLVTGMSVTGTGAAVGLVSLCYSNSYNRSKRQLASVGLIGSGIAALTGLILMHKGITLSSARLRLKKAREIETMISLKSVHHE